jgi:hypothetical protein
MAWVFAGWLAPIVSKGTVDPGTAARMERQGMGPRGQLESLLLKSQWAMGALVCAGLGLLILLSTLLLVRREGW